MLKTFCPKCTWLHQIEINDSLTEIMIICSCGYERTLSVEKYFDIIKTIKTKKKNEEISRGKEHLFFYFSFLKNNAINASKQDKNKIESSYKMSYHKNNNILSLLNILQEGYPNLKYRINIYQYNDDVKNVDKIIKYYENYHIVSFEKKSTIKFKKIKFELFHLATGSLIYCAILLKDGRLTVGTDKGDIQIFNINNKCKREMIRKLHQSQVSELCQLNSGDLVSAALDGTMKISSINGKKIINLITINEAFSLFPSKIIEISDNRLVTCAGMSPIKMWDIRKPYKNKLIKELNQSLFLSVCLFYIEKKDLLFSGGENVYLWNTRTFKITSIFKVVCRNKNCMCLIDKNKIIIGGENSLAIINFEKMIIEEYIIFEETDFNSFLLLPDKVNVLCGSTNRTINLSVYNVNTKTFENFPFSKASITRINEIFSFGPNMLITIGEFTFQLALWEFQL